MKKLLLFVLVSFFVGTLAAQTTEEEAGKLKNAGNAAWKAKNSSRLLKPRILCAIISPKRKIANQIFLRRGIGQSAVI